MENRKRRNVLLNKFLHLSNASACKNVEAFFYELVWLVPNLLYFINIPRKTHAFMCESIRSKHQIPYLTTTTKYLGKTVLSVCL